MVRGAHGDQGERASRGHTRGDAQGEVGPPRATVDDPIVAESPSEDVFELNPAWTRVLDLARWIGLGASPARSSTASGPTVGVPPRHGGLPDGGSGRRPGSFLPSGQSSHGRIRQVGRVEARGYLDRRREVLSGRGRRSIGCPNCREASNNGAKRASVGSGRVRIRKAYVCASGPSACPASRSPARSANAAAWTRLVTPSFRRMLVM